MTLQMPLDGLSLEELRGLQAQKEIELNDLKKHEASIVERRREIEHQEHLIVDAINRKKLGLDNQP